MIPVEGVLKKQTNNLMCVLFIFTIGTYHESKEMKGLDIVRRDWCELAKDAGKYVVLIKFT